VINLETEKQIKIGEKTFTIKRFTFKEKGLIYRAAAKVDPRTGRIKTMDVYELMLNALRFGIKEPEMSLEEIENMDGAIAEYIFNKIMEFNTLPFFK